MAGDVRIRITGSDETAAAFRSVEAGAHRLEKGLSFLTKFSLGAGAGIGVAALVSHINHLAEKLADANPEAKKFTESMDRLRGVVDTAFVGLFKAINPILGDMAELAESASNSIGDLADSFREYAAARDKQREADSQYYKNTEEYKRLTELNASAPSSYRGQVFRSAPQAAALKSLGLMNALNAKAEEEAAAKKSTDALVKIEKEKYARFAELDKLYVDEEVSMREAYLDGAKAFAKKKENIASAAYEAAMAADEKVNKIREEQVEKANLQAEKFGDFFADNLIESATSGFKEMARKFVETLIYMAARAAAINLFKSIFPSGVSAAGGAAGGMGSFFGFASGGSFEVGGQSGTDSNLVAFRATRGERVTVTRPGQGGGGATTIINNIDARNATDPAAIAAAVRIATGQSRAQRMDDRRRGR